MSESRPHPPSGVPLRLLDGEYAVARLPARAARRTLASLPPWPEDGFVSIGLSGVEFSLVGPAAWVRAVLADSRPAGAADDGRLETGWRALRVDGVLDFSMVGVTAALSTPLARAGVSLLLIATFDTDSLLVRERDLAAALAALGGAGHTVSAAGGSPPAAAG